MMFTSQIVCHHSLSLSINGWFLSQALYKTCKVIIVRTYLICLFSSSFLSLPFFPLALFLEGSTTTTQEQQVSTLQSEDSLTMNLELCVCVCV